MASSAKFQINSDLANFLIGPVAMVVAVGGIGRKPHAIRGYAASLSGDRSRISIHVPTLHFCGPDRVFEAGGNIAVVFSRVRDFKTYQLKGRDAEVGPSVPGTSSGLATYCDAFFAELALVGLPRRASEGLRFAKYTLLTFTPTAAFAQTPGPNAGKAIGQGQ